MLGLHLVVGWGSGVLIHVDLLGLVGVTLTSWPARIALPIPASFPPVTTTTPIPSISSASPTSTSASSSGPFPILCSLPKIAIRDGHSDGLLGIESFLDPQLKGTI